MRGRWVLLTWLALRAGLATADPEQQAKQDMAQGVSLFEKGKYAEAILQFQRVLKVFPDAAGPHRELGKCYQKLKSYDEAIDHYVRFLALKPNDKESPAIEALLPTFRTSLPKTGRALLSVTTTPTRAVVFAVTSRGEERAIGFTPLEEHPLEVIYVKLRFEQENRILGQYPITPKENEPLRLELDLTQEPKIEPPKTGPIRPEVTPEQPPALTPRPGLTRGALVVGAGSLAFSSVAAVGFGLNVLQIRKEQKSVGGSFATLEALQAQAQDRALAAEIAFGVGAAAGTLYLLEKRSTQAEPDWTKRSALGFSIASAGAAAGLGASFFLTRQSLQEALLDPLVSLEQRAALEARAKREALLSEIALGVTGLSTAAWLGAKLRPRTTAPQASLQLGVSSAQLQIIF